jgi:hypothetical protein
VKPETQTDRVVRYIRTHPGCSSLDIIRDCMVLNTTGRISDARKEGHLIDCRRVDGVARYWLREAPRQLAWTA